MHTVWFMALLPRYGPKNVERHNCSFPLLEHVLTPSTDCKCGEAFHWQMWNRQVSSFTARKAPSICLALFFGVLSDRDRPRCGARSTSRAPSGRFHFISTPRCVWSPSCQGFLQLASCSFSALVKVLAGDPHYRLTTRRQPPWPYGLQRTNRTTKRRMATIRRHALVP